MNRDDQNFHNMVRAVLQTRVDHPVAASSPLVLVQIFNTVSSLEALLNSARRAAGEELEPITLAKDELKRLMADAVCVPLGMLEAKASIAGNTKLALQAHVVPSDFTGLGDQDAANHALNVMELLTGPEVTALKATFGLTDAQHTLALGLVDEFARAVGSPRSAIVNREAHAAIAGSVIDQIRHILTTQLDPMMRQYDLKPTDSGSITKKAFYDAYRAAREIVDLAPGSGGGDEGGTTPPEGAGAPA